MYDLRVEKGRSANTVEAYARDLNRFALWLEEQGVTEPPQVHREHVTGWLAALHDAGLGARSIARARSSVRGLFGYLVTEGHLEENPTANIPAPRFTTPLPTVLSAQAIER